MWSPHRRRRRPLRVFWIENGSRLGWRAFGPLWERKRKKMECRCGGRKPCSQLFVRGGGAVVTVLLIAVARSCCAAIVLLAVDSVDTVRYARSFPR